MGSSPNHLIFYPAKYFGGEGGIPFSAEKATAVAICHRHIAKSRLSNPHHIIRQVFWRRGWDSNPRALSDKRFSRPPRYDRFDTSPYHMPDKQVLLYHAVCALSSIFLFYLYFTPLRRRALHGFVMVNCANFFVCLALSAQTRYTEFRFTETKTLLFWNEGDCLWLRFIV